MEKPRIVVGMSGASGTPLAYKLLSILKEIDAFEVHLVASNGARLTAQYEFSHSFEELETLADFTHDISAVGDSLASGTFKTKGMIIIPCSMKTVAGIASGYTDNLLLRAADVTIKENRPLILVARETPLSPIHLKNLSFLASIQNVVIMPPMLTYYHNPQSIEDMEYHLIAKILDRFGVDLPDYKRWMEE